MNDYTYEVVNPEAFKQNKTAQKQFAKWLLEFGLKVGTIKDPAKAAADMYLEKEAV